jgi:penicillin-insensitive murein endopeptidase
LVPSPHAAHNPENVRIAWVSLLALAACAPLGGVNDGTSLARGSTSGGVLINAVRLPVRGDGYVIPQTWASRGLNWGTEELVTLIVRAARRVDKETRDGVPLYVADLSPREGGPSAWHRSHQTGRDADLIFFFRDDAGRPTAPPTQMIAFGPDGGSAATDGTGRPIPRLWFDVERNWLLVRALLDDPVVEVQYLFVSTALRQKLLDHARAIGEAEDVIARAEMVLVQPSDSLPHDDHLHLRILCPASDRALGCRERGPLRWHKKLYKYAENQSLALGAGSLPVAPPFCQIVLQAVVAAL